MVLTVDRSPHCSCSVGGSVGVSVGGDGGSSIGGGVDVGSSIGSLGCVGVSSSVGDGHSVGEIGSSPSVDGSSSGLNMTGKVSSTGVPSQWRQTWMGINIRVRSI